MAAQFGLGLCSHSHWHWTIKALFSQWHEKNHAESIANIPQLVIYSEIKTLQCAHHQSRTKATGSWSDAGFCKQQWKVMGVVRSSSSCQLTHEGSYQDKFTKSKYDYGWKGSHGWTSQEYSSSCKHRDKTWGAPEASCGVVEDFCLRGRLTDFVSVSAARQGDEDPLSQLRKCLPG